jgi:large subunit ribosomal protein L36
MSPLRSALSTASRSLLSIRQFALTSFRQTNHASTSPFTQLRKFSVLMSQSRWGGLLRLRIAAGGNAKQLSSTYVFSQASGMKTRSSVKRLCDGCKVSYFREISMGFLLGKGVLTVW